MRGLRTYPERRLSPSQPFRMDHLFADDPRFVGGHGLWDCTASPAIETWGTSGGVANRPVAPTLFLDEEITVYQLGWWNGSGTQTDHMDVGIYDASWTRLVSSGSTAKSGLNQEQRVNVADTKIGPGKFYLALACDATGQSHRKYALPASTALMAWAGVFDATSDQFPLPSSLAGQMAAASQFQKLPFASITARNTTT